MALHIGAAQERDGDYYGPPLNRVARLMAAGHGGQMLLSRATAELVRDDLPTDVSAARPGRAPAQGSARPEHIFQTGRARSARRLSRRCRRWTAAPNNLPAQPTALIGREREVAAVGCACCGAPTCAC